MSEAWLALVVTRASSPCDCHDCVVADVQRPPVELRRTSRAPRRWLHGAQLAQFYRAEDAATVRRNAIFARLKQDIQAQTGGLVKRGSEIPHRPAPARGDQ